MSEAPLLEVRSIRAGYGPIEVLHDVDFQVYPGKVAALLGPNGGGKSTLLNVCAGVHPADEGEVWFEGENVTKTSAGALSRRWHLHGARGAGHLPQLDRPGERAHGHPGGRGDVPLGGA